jgi:mono/diheme cytochrome c family protein
VAIGFVALAAIGWTGLTATAVATTPRAAEVAVDYSGPTDWLELTPEEMAGVAYFREESCASCHALGAAGGKVGPDLTRMAIHKDAAWMLDHFKRPSAMRPGSSMPPIQLSDAQLNALAAFLLKLNPKNAAALESAPDFAARGAQVYQTNQCGMCHTINGSGMSIGPQLNGVAKRRSQDWVARHFADPAKVSPGSMMPPYRLSPQDLDNLTAYLFALPE